MQDATAQMALLQFMMAGRSSTAVPSTVHCDHLVQAKKSASEDLAQAMDKNGEVYDFLESVSSKYGIGFGNQVQVSFTKLFWKIMLFPVE